MGQGSAASPGGRGLAHRRTPHVGREEILSCQPASRGEPAHVSCHYQGAMDLRAGSSATERGTRSRSLRRTILERPSSSRAHDNDRLRVPPASPSHQSEAGKKESTDHRLNQACQPCATPSSTSSFGRFSDARTAEDGSASDSSMSKICQSSASLASKGSSHFLALEFQPQSLLSQSFPPPSTGPPWAFRQYRDWENLPALCQRCSSARDARSTFRSCGCRRDRAAWR